MIPDGSPSAFACEIGAAALRRPLSPVERQAHEAHLSSCADCRLIARMNADLAPLGDLRPGDEAVVARTAEAVLAGLNTLQPNTFHQMSGRRAVLGLLALVLVVGTSAAAVAARRQLLQLASNAGAVLFPNRRIFHGDRAIDNPPHASARAAPSNRTAVVVPPAEIGLATTPSRLATPPVPPTVAVAIPEARRLPRSASSARATIPDRRDSPARELLARGAAARARGERGVAVSFFRQLRARYPGTVEAQVALISSGQLLLDAGNFTEALAAFRAYSERAPTGPLLEEALDGAARSLFGLRRFDEERTAWREMVTRFPRSAYLSRATRRLRDLR